MEADALPVGQDVQVVDPEVRAHVYSLVTAVCDPAKSVKLRMELTASSSVDSMVKMLQSTVSVTMRSHVYATSRNGSSCTTKRQTAWTLRDAWGKQILSMEISFPYSLYGGHEAKTKNIYQGLLWLAVRRLGL